MHLLSFAATTSRRSINRLLIGAAIDHLTDELGDGLTSEILDLADFEMPMYSIDREREDGIPEPAGRFRHRIGEADALLISFAEHNGGYTVAYKNVFDWASRIDRNVYQGRPAVLMATSPGARGGATVLRSAVSLAPIFGLDVRGELSIPRFEDHFDREAGRLTDPDHQTQLRDALEPLVALGRGETT